MARITIEGSVTPSTFLGRGERTTVDRSPFIDKLIRKGYVVVVEEKRPVMEEIAALVEKQIETTALEAKVTGGVPPKSAAKADWAAWLDRNSIGYDEDATRADMIALWEAEPEPETEAFDG